MKPIPLICISNKKKKYLKNIFQNVEFFFSLLLTIPSLLSFSPIHRPCRPVPRKDTGPSLLGCLTLSSSSPSPAFYSEAKTVSTSSLLNGPLSYSQSSDIIKVRTRGHQARSALVFLLTQSHFFFCCCFNVQKDVAVMF